MKYMNHLGKLALLSSLALSFAVHADGTLPLPITKLPVVLTGNVNGALTEGNAPLEVDIQSLETVATVPNVGGFGNPCARSSQFFAAEGTVTVGSEVLDVSGVCRPQTAGSTNRVVVASSGGKLVLLDGNAESKQIGNELLMTAFKGTMLVKTEGANSTSLRFQLVRSN